MESLTVSNQNMANLAKPNGLNNNLRLKRRNGINQFQFEQQIMNARLKSLESTMADMNMADDDSILDQNNMTSEF